MINHILNSILAWLFGILKRQKADYPAELKEATKKSFLDKIRNRE